MNSTDKKDLTIKTFGIVTSALALSAAPAFAGSTTPPPADPPVMAPVPVATTPDWTGSYGGVQLGYGNVDSNIPGGGDGVIGGLTAGYDIDIGNFSMAAAWTMTLWISTSATVSPI